MKDNDLIRIFLPIINQGLIDGEYLGVTVKQGNQPTQQGANSNPTIYFFKLFDKRYGWRLSKSEWDDELETMVHTYVQYYETTFQVEALVRQKPSTPYQYTAADLLNEVAFILQTEGTITTLNNSEIGILRITDVRNPNSGDDRDQFEAVPSFDFTLIHKQTRTTTDPVIESIEFGIKRV